MKSCENENKTKCSAPIDLEFSVKDIKCAIRDVENIFDDIGISGYKVGKYWNTIKTYVLNKIKEG